MSFKYINPGYANLLYNRDSSYLTQFINNQFSRTGVCFKNTRNDYGNCVSCSTSFSEYWIKADVYIDSSINTILCISEEWGSEAWNGVKLEINTSGVYLTIHFSSGSKQYILAGVPVTELQSATGIKKAGINSIWVHVKNGTPGVGFVELCINNKRFEPFQSQYKISNRDTELKVKLYSTTGYFSSIIVSDEEISPNERVVLLPVSNTFTNMESLSGGLYQASTASETLLQSVDVSSLIQNYGSDTSVTGIAMIGNPAYEVDDVIGSLTSITKQNGSVTEHDKRTLSTDTDSVIVSSLSLPSDTTIADLVSMQFGWRAEE